MPVQSPHAQKLSMGEQMTSSLNHYETFSKLNRGGRSISEGASHEQRPFASPDPLLLSLQSWNNLRLAALLESWPYSVGPHPHLKMGGGEMRKLRRFGWERKGEKGRKGLQVWREMIKDSICYLSLIFLLCLYKNSKHFLNIAGLKETTYFVFPVKRHIMF